MQDSVVKLSRGDARQSTMLTDARLRARLVYYSPGATFGEHHHDRDFLTLVLLGEMEEICEGRTGTTRAPFASFMPAGLHHSNRYGPNGTLCLCFDFPRSTPPPGLRNGGLAKLNSRVISTLDGLEHVDSVRHFLTRPVHSQPDVLADLAGHVLKNAKPPPPPPPDWLEHVRASLDNPDCTESLEALARRAGVHRVHLTRSFQRCFGMPPKRYRLDQMCLRAMSRAILDGESLSEAAWSAGFCDPSHGAREIRKRVGSQPHLLQRWLRN